MVLTLENKRAPVRGGISQFEKVRFDFDQLAVVVATEEILG
jgi:hypothetical protein